MEFLIDSFEQNWLLYTSIFISVVGAFLLFSTVVSKLRTNKGLIQTRQHKSAVSERIFVKGAFILLGVGALGIVMNQLSLSKPSYSDLSISEWYGTWSVYQEEFGDFGYNKGLFELEILDEEGKIKGIVFNDRGREEGFISSIRVNGNRLVGKYGRNDGRKMEVDFLLFPDGSSFLGRYRNRHGHDRWKSWVSHKY